MTAKVKSFYGTGRRKSSIARVYVKPGKGAITINGLDVKAYFPHDTLVIDLKQPLTVLGVEGKYDVTAEVYGPRAKERKKYGLKKARRAPQFSKR